jgi:hypothetical protein
VQFVIRIDSEQKVTDAAINIREDSCDTLLIGVVDLTTDIPCQVSPTDRCRIDPGIADSDHVSGLLESSVI